MPIVAASGRNKPSKALYPRNFAHCKVGVKSIVFKHQSIVFASIVVVHLFTYAKNAILLSILTVSRVAIKRNKTWCYLLAIRVFNLSTQQLFP